MTKFNDTGFDQWFQSQVSDLRQEGRDITRISAVDCGSYLVRNPTKEVPAELAGKFYFLVESSIDLPCVGDWVTVQYYNNDTAAIIHEVLPRKTYLRRKSAGEKVDFQMIAANIDVAFIVQSCHFDFKKKGTDLFFILPNKKCFLRAVHAKNSTNSCNWLSTPHHSARTQQAGRICIR